jgi:hypothetical protein
LSAERGASAGLTRALEEVIESAFRGLINASADVGCIINLSRIVEKGPHVMWIRTTVALITAMAFGCVSTGAANAHKLRKHHVPHVAGYDIPPGAPVASYDGPRLVLHPALNYACMTNYQSTRALPCDQPVWVYGSPCEIDLGLGRSRRCE